MSTQRAATGQAHACMASVVLVCTTCQHTWEPNLLDQTDRSEAASTGCPLCGGWTWIGQITEPGHSLLPTVTPTTRRTTTR